MISETKHLLVRYLSVKINNDVKFFYYCSHFLISIICAFFAIIYFNPFLGVAAIMLFIDALCNIDRLNNERFVERLLEDVKEDILDTHILQKRKALEFDKNKD